MWYLEKEVWISSAHFLNDYIGACSNIHGHNWLVKVYCKGDKLDKAGMLIDFKEIKGIVDQLDHKNLNLVVPVNPTAENLAKYICELVPHCWQVEIHEAKGSVARYVKD